MSAGTLTLTNNSAAVTGSGTAFTTELVAGDFIVANVGG
ncbi:tail fiber domain-containing protein, partial [Citrobacter freundii]|nr:tail fiber domain-containing protein [Citrobacter freundii]